MLVGLEKIVMSFETSTSSGNEMQALFYATIMPIARIALLDLCVGDGWFLVLKERHWLRSRTRPKPVKGFELQWRSVRVIMYFSRININLTKAKPLLREC